MSLLIFNSGCILFSSGDIPYTVSDMIDSAQDNIISEPDVVDTDEGVLEEELMLSHLKLYHFAPRTDDYLDLSYEDHTIVFDDMGGCSEIGFSWDNLTYQAFDEQIKTLAIPNGLYGVELTLESNGNGHFDDHMTLDINGYLVYSSDIQIVDSLSVTSSFDWNEVEGQSMSPTLVPFCGMSCLEFYQNNGPNSQTFNGAMAIEFDPIALYSLLEEEDEMVLSIKVFGDNDINDCALRNMTANVQFTVNN
jgi:hypothetical protein